MLAALDNLERFMHDEKGVTPPVIKAGLAHAQFETIHPFLDGNGRVGRLLVSLMLVVDGVGLSQPFLYLSLYFRENRADYYDALQRVRTHGDWEGWVGFYLIGVEDEANQAADTVRALVILFDQDRARIQGLGRATGSALQVYDVLRRRIVVSIPGVAKEAGITWPYGEGGTGAAADAEDRGGKHRPAARPAVHLHPAARNPESRDGSVTPHGFTEDQLVEQPALEVLETLGWEVISAAEEVFGAGSTLGRETPGEAVLLPRLHAALRRLNPALPPEAITVAVDEAGPGPIGDESGGGQPGGLAAAQGRSGGVGARPGGGGQKMRGSG